MDIKSLIPQREPFLFINEVLSIDKNVIQVSMQFGAELDFFKGHFPGDPIVPGVLLSEHCFQSGAALIASQNSKDVAGKKAVLTRIQQAKFKNIVRPNEIISTTTQIKEQVGDVAFFKSIVTNSDAKKVLIIEFACALIK
ncbi:MAG: beta-hydroxyacyl-ACP dehydratase [Halobacteriovoraceae bacterium]|jgi:3-hydroxyacyl-[acyl-carrier-protein] dehydratase|nr:beta-hydroxyacyl-ACP dehydratase [Halobacteriovoraceae bacterium]